MKRQFVPYFPWIPWNGQSRRDCVTWWMVLRSLKEAYYAMPVESSTCKRGARTLWLVGRLNKTICRRSVGGGCFRDEDCQNAVHGPKVVLHRSEMEKRNVENTSKSYLTPGLEWTMIEPSKFFWKFSPITGKCDYQKIIVIISNYQCPWIIHGRW